EILIINYYINSRGNMMTYLKNNILLIFIIVILLCNLTAEILQIFILNDIKDRTGVPYKIESLIENIRGFNQSILWDLKDILKRL
ncbi:MAG: hypothetical protein ACLSWI_05275, partial [Candidatus Gastranaerophilaceae bacterium]